MADEIFYLTSEELCDKLMKSNDKQEIDQIISLFNLNLQKREVIRASVLSELQDDISHQMTERVRNNADCFSNKDLIDYMKTVQSLLDSQKTVDTSKVPSIAIQNNVTINGDDELSNDSRQKIADYIKSVLYGQAENIIDSTAEEKEEKDGE